MQSPLRTLREMLAIAQSRGVAPPRFDAKSAPEVREVDLELVRLGLARIRHRRRWAHWPFLMSWGGGILLVFWGNAGLPLLPVPLVVADALADAAILVSFGCLMFVPVRGLRCPRCREAFHSRRGYNPIARRCEHCDLRLDGANASEPFTVRDPYD